MALYDLYVCVLPTDVPKNGNARNDNNCRQYMAPLADVTYTRPEVDSLELAMFNEVNLNGQWTFKRQTLAHCRLDGQQ